MSFLSESQKSLLHSRRIEDDQLALLIASRLQASFDSLSPSQIIEKIIADPDFVDHDPYGINRDQVRIRTDRAIASSVIMALRPRSVVETGTSDGLASSIFLYGMMSVNNGYLFSIDLPHRQDWTEIKQTTLSQSGSMIPPKWKSRHINIIEDAKTALPRILPKYQPRVFIHDSLHTVTHMLYEYSVARAFMPPKSLIVSDDILWNDAFLGFCQITGSEFYVSGSNPNYGYAIMDISEDDLGVWGSHELLSYLEDIE